MTYPFVQINAQNQRSGESTELERLALFVGVGTTNLNQLLSVTPDSDLDALLGKADSELKKQVRAAMLNAGQNSFARIYAMSQEDFNVQTAVRAANQTGSFEYVVNTHTLGIDKTAINALQELYAELLAKYGRRQFFIQALDGINHAQDGGETWAQYLARLTTLQRGIAAEHVMLVPNLFGADAGALAGRLASRAVSIADSPCRVKTGALVGVASEKPADKDGVLLDVSHLKSLEQARYSTAMWYPDYDGLYWSDGRMLDAEGGDFQCVENVRVVDKAARRVRLLAISKIGDRALNSSIGSMESHKTFFAQVLREMSKSAQINGAIFPGECYPPQEGDVEIVWKSKTQVDIYLIVRTVECPKGITVNILLDLTTLGGGQ